MKVLRTALVALLISLIAAPVAAAQEGGGLELVSTILRQVETLDEKGETIIELVAVEKAMPGEELVVRVEYTNRGQEPAENIVIVNPVPDQMSYVAGSASGDLVQATFSIDGGASFEMPEKLLVRDEAGNLKQASPGDYTHVRFSRTGALAPGGTGEVTFRGVLK